MKRITLIFVFAIFLSACNQDDGDSVIKPFVGKEYVSLRVGQEAIYQIDSTIYDDFSGTTKLVSLQQKEYIERAERDAANRETFIVEIYTRAADTLPWRINRITRRTMTDFRYEVLDNNTMTVPLVFPIVLDKRWNTNVLNANTGKDYEYTTVNEPFSNGNLQYDSTVSILQFEEENLIEQILEVETHAAGVGLILRQHKDIETEFNGDIRSGFESEMRLISFN